MIRPKRIFIVGHMGAGKSLFGKALAEKLGWRYIDANLGLERYYGRRLNEIIGKQGEEAFHECEAEVLSHYIKEENVVVVMEDGVVTTEKNRKLLSSQFVIYLKVNTPTQIERTSHGMTPIFPIADQKIFLDKFHDERDHLFEEVATLTLDSISVEDDVNKTIQLFENNSN